MADFPPVPLTLEGSSVLHQFFRFDWKAWRACAQPRERDSRSRPEVRSEALQRSRAQRRRRARPVRALLRARPQGRPDPRPLPRFARGAEPDRADSRRRASTTFSHSVHSYVSVVELGLYESTPQDLRSRSGQGLRAALAGVERRDCRIARAQRAKPWRRASSLPCPRRSTCASIPWTASAASR